MNEANRIAEKKVQAMRFPLAAASYEALGGVSGRTPRPSRAV